MFSKTTLIGRLGKDPEMRFTPAGQPTTTFSVATDHQYTGSDGKTVKETTWYRVQTWGKLAENCNTYLQKGKMVMVEGRITVDKETGSPRIWNGEDGKPHTSLEMVASLVKFLSGKDGASGGSGDSEYSDPVSTDDIPF